MKSPIRRSIVVLSTAVLSCSVSAADLKSAGKEMEALIGVYLQLWNAHDSEAIIRRIYRLDEGHPWRTQPGLQAEFDRLKEQGYDRSEIAGVVGCATSAEAGHVEIRFTRWKTDGSFMPPKDRTSLYTLKRFTDGWRVTGMKALPSGERMQCNP